MAQGRRRGAMRPTLAADLQAIVDAEYPRFSPAEMARRRSAIETLLEAADADHLLYCGANRFGSAVQWLAQWPVTTEAIGVLSPGRRDSLFVQYFNHVPLARRLADADVAWGGESSIRAAAAALERRGARSGRVAAIGPMTVDQDRIVSERFGRIKNLNKDYIALRMVKSQEEIDWLRIGAYFTDRATAALREGLKPGLTE